MNSVGAHLSIEVMMDARGYTSERSSILREVKRPLLSAEELGSPWNIFVRTPDESRGRFGEPTYRELSRSGSTDLVGTKPEFAIEEFHVLIQAKLGIGRWHWSRAVRKLGNQIIHSPKPR